MNLHEILGREGIDLRLSVQSDAQAIQSLVHRLVETGRLDPRHETDAILALLKREATSGTHVGNSLAIPHAKVPYVKDFALTLGVVHHGLQFGGGTDPVTVVVLLLSPDWDPDGHVRLMSEIARLAMDPSFSQRITSARTVDEVLEALGADDGPAEPATP